MRPREQEDKLRKRSDHGAVMMRCFGFTLRNAFLAGPLCGFVGMGYLNFSASVQTWFWNIFLFVTALTGLSTIVAAEKRRGGYSRTDQFQYAAWFMLVLLLVGKDRWVLGAIWLLFLALNIRRIRDPHPLSHSTIDEDGSRSFPA
jgi:hypothetical protein